MQWNDHSNLEGKHAVLAPSSYHWLNYDDDKLRERYKGMMAKDLGTRLHKWAEDTIRLGIKQPRSEKTLYMYVNDAIKFGMRVEQPLMFSWNCYGHADAISFDGKILRIHDLKTGETVAHMEQLEIYAALFCLEYNRDPHDFEIELRIYQTDQIAIFKPEPQDIIDIMNTIIRMDGIIEQLKREDL